MAGMIVPVPMIATSLPANPGIMDNLQYQTTGLLVVLLTLGGMSVILWLVGKLFIILDRPKAAAAVAAPAATAPLVPAEIHAAIAAAVSVTLEDGNVVIREIHSADPRTNLAWGVEGRRSIYASKKLR